jgi:hypothetical protein
MVVKLKTRLMSVLGLYHSILIKFFGENAGKNEKLVFIKNV